MYRVEFKITATVLVDAQDDEEAAAFVEMQDVQELMEQIDQGEADSISLIVEEVTEVTG